MKVLKSIFYITVLSFIFFGCNPLKQLQTAQNDAEKEYNSKNYQLAFEKYTTLIDKYKQGNIEVPYNLYINTASSAMNIGNYDAAIKNYQEALSDSVSLNAVKNLIAATEKTANNNLPGILDKYGSYLKDNGEEEYYNIKLFENAVRSGNQDKIITSYRNLKTPNESQSMEYVKALEISGKKKDAISFCNELVKNNPEFFKAKEYRGEYYYNFAENWYKNEMAKYNKDKNYTAYVYLKRELKKISANYRLAKNEYEALHAKYPSEKKYIKYLKNIYLRLEMKNEAADMDKLLK